MRRLDLWPSNEIVEQYRAVFSGRAGLLVLKHMLYDLGAFVEISDGPEDVALKNYGMRLLRILGGGEVGEDAIEQFTKRLVRQPLPNENKED